MGFWENAIIRHDAPVVGAAPVPRRRGDGLLAPRPRQPDPTKDEDEDEEEADLVERGGRLHDSGESADNPPPPAAQVGLPAGLARRRLYPSRRAGGALQWPPFPAQPGRDAREDARLSAVVVAKVIPPCPRRRSVDGPAEGAPPARPDDDDGAVDRHPSIPRAGTAGPPEGLAESGPGTAPVAEATP